MLVRDFDFDLPADLIAQQPAAQHGESRLLGLSRSSGQIAHSSIGALPTLLRAGDVVVVNNSRVFPARLLGRRVPGGGPVECLLVARLGVEGPSGGERWEALLHPGQKLKPGAALVFEGAATLHGEVLAASRVGRREIRLWADGGGSVSDTVDRIGHVPLPPYIKRNDRQADRARYQTMFARRRGSIAAPTAGLHFTDTVLAALGERGIEVAELTLHVGYGTFQPVRVERVEDHQLDPEWFEIPPATAQAVNRALHEGRRVVAVGTTTTRTLEAVARLHGDRLVATSGLTDLFIYPGFDFRVVSGLLTNFHVPRSSLLMLVSAFAGREPVLAAYREAIAARYRFYSYGDAMLIL